jgi:hypothetical protein
MGSRKSGEYETCEHHSAASLFHSTQCFSVGPSCGVKNRGTLYERANVRTDAEGAISGYLKDEMKSDGQVLKQHGEGFAPSALACYG